MVCCWRGRQPPPRFLFLWVVQDFNIIDWCTEQQDLWFEFWLDWQSLCVEFACSLHRFSLKTDILMSDGDCIIAIKSDWYVCVQWWTVQSVHCLYPIWAGAPGDTLRHKVGSSSIAHSYRWCREIFVSGDDFQCLFNSILLTFPSCAGKHPVQY